MLNRKLSDYLFGAVLLSILLAVLLVRQVSLGNINANIDNVKAENISLNLKIDKLEQRVEENRDIQNDHLYELYSHVPSYYSYDELYFNLLAELYNVGITDNDEFAAKIEINGDLNTKQLSVSEFLNKDYEMAYISISFNTNSVETIEDLVDNLYHSEQIFVVNSVEYDNPLGELVSVNITLYTFYNIQK